MVQRHSIVTRRPHDKAELIRFCLSPEGNVVPDLKGTLPGRGAWVELSRAAVDEAVKRKSFARALKCQPQVPADLSAQLDQLLTQKLLGSLKLARRGGGIITGAQKVEIALRSGKAAAVLHATGAAEDGRRKIAQAIFAAQKQGFGPVMVETIFDEDQLARAFGGNHVIHVAIMRGLSSAGVMEDLRRLKLYRQEKGLEHSTKSVKLFSDKDAVGTKN